MQQELTPAQYEATKKYLRNKELRISSLYHVLDKAARPVIYKHNTNQQKIFAKRWYNIIILKSRRIGSTTGWAVDTFDLAFWTPYIRIGVISELNSSAAKIVEKIKFAHIMLPEEVRSLNPIVVDNKYELGFKNGSSIYSETSFRGDTVQRLLISEFGPICSERPDKANKIKAGALSTVDMGQEVIIESTARGPGGHFHQWVMEANERQQRGIKPSKMDYYLIFIPWWQDPECTLNPEGVEINQRYAEYFKKLEPEIKTQLTSGQKAFYVKKANILGPDIYSEYPATIPEAFSQNDEGKYYRKEFIDIYNENRICKVAHERGFPVTVSFDIGIGYSAIWFSQTCGTEEHIINYVSASGAYAEDLYKITTDLSKEFGYQYDYFVWPFDIKVREQFSKDATRFVTVVNLFGMDRCVICPDHTQVSFKDGIQTTRQYLSRCYFDGEKCDEGIKGLKNYSMEWGEHLQRYMENSPRGDEFSHPADSFRYMAIFKAIKRGHGIRRDTNSNVQVYTEVPVNLKAKWGAFI